MAATAWAFYNSAKHKMGNGDTSGFNFSADVFKIALHKSAATAPAETATLSVWSSVSAECTGGAYATGGKSLSSPTWTATAATTQKFDSNDTNDWVITASTTAITSVKYAVIRNSTAASEGYVLCWSQLSSSVISVAAGNTLTIQNNAAGIFTLF